MDFYKEKTKTLVRRNDKQEDILLSFDNEEFQNFQNDLEW